MLEKLEGKRTQTARGMGSIATAVDDRWKIFRAKSGTNILEKSLSI